MLLEAGSFFMYLGAMASITARLTKFMSLILECTREWPPFRYSIASNTWISPHFRGDGPDAREGQGAALIETFVWQCAVTSGISPAARDSHTCSSWNDKIIVIGGEDGHDYYLSDVHVLDTGFVI
ncbi:hypothetical protein Ancab_038778 [Ancistrocladus abbreviatus]